jgi:hypothetical protein
LCHLQGAALPPTTPPLPVPEVCQSCVSHGKVKISGPKPRRRRPQLLPPPGVTRTTAAATSSPPPPQVTALSPKLPRCRSLVSVPPRPCEFGPRRAPNAMETEGGALPPPCARPSAGGAVQWRRGEGGEEGGTMGSRRPRERRGVRGFICAQHVNEPNFQLQSCVPPPPFSPIPTLDLPRLDSAAAKTQASDAHSSSCSSPARSPDPFRG